MLPPNLTRNYYEVKRLIAEGDGRQLPHWYQLTSEQKRSEELNVELFRRAILRAEEEQDLVASFNAPAAQQQPAATESAAPATEPCDCPGCSLVPALAELIKQAKRLETILGWDADGSGNSTVYAFKPVSLTPEQRADLEKRAKEAIARWVAAGKPLTTPGWIPTSRVGLDGFEPSLLGLQRWGFLLRPAPQVSVRDTGQL